MPSLEETLVDKLEAAYLAGRAVYLDLDLDDLIRKYGKAEAKRRGQEHMRQAKELLVPQAIRESLKSLNQEEQELWRKQRDAYSQRAAEQARRRIDQEKSSSDGQPERLRSESGRSSGDSNRSIPHDLNAIGPQEAIRRKGFVREQGPMGTGRNYRHPGEIGGPTDRRPVVYPEGTPSWEMPRGSLRFRPQFPGGPSEMINGVGRGYRTPGGAGGR